MAPAGNQRETEQMEVKECLGVNNYGRNNERKERRAGNLLGISPSRLRAC